MKCGAGGEWGTEVRAVAGGLAATIPRSPYSPRKANALPIQDPSPKTHDSKKPRNPFMLGASSSLLRGYPRKVLRGRIWRRRQKNSPATLGGATLLADGVAGDGLGHRVAAVGGVLIANGR